MQARVTTDEAPLEAGERPGGRLRRASLLTMIGLGSFFSCYSRTFVLPNTPILFWGDQLLYATNGARIIAGQTPYRDFFEFMPAGTDLLYAQLFRIFGVRLWVPNLLMALLGAAAILLATIAGEKILRGPFRVAPSLMGLGFGLYAGLDATHHWLSTVATLGAMTLLLRGTGWKQVGWAGVLCGVAASFTQSKGAAVTAGFVLYLLCRSTSLTESLRARSFNCLLLCGSALGAFLCFNGHFIVTLGLKEWCRWVILFPLRYYATMPGQTLSAPLIEFQSHHGLMRWAGAAFLYAAVPIAYMRFLWIWRKRARRDDQSWNPLLLVCITGMAMLFSIAPSLSLMRASAACFPATILLSWYLQGLSRRLGWIMPVFVAISAACVLSLGIGAQRAHWLYLDLPAGKTAIREPEKYELYRWLKEHTYPGEDYFGIAPISLPLNLQCPAPIQQPGPWQYYRPEHIARSIAVLETRRVPILVLRPSPGVGNTPSYDDTRLKELQKYIEMHYRLIRQFPTGDQAWERNSGQIGAIEP